MTSWSAARRRFCPVATGTPFSSLVEAEMSGLAPLLREPRPAQPTNAQPQQPQPTPFRRCTTGRSGLKPPV